MLPAYLASSPSSRRRRHRRRAHRTQPPRPAPSATIETLITACFVHGLAGAVGIAIAQAAGRDLYSGSELVRCYGRLTVLAGLTAIIGPVIGGQLALVTRLARPVPAPRRRRRRHPGRPPPSCSRETLPRRQRVTADLPVPWAPAANTTRRGPHPGRVLVDGVGDQVAGAGFAPATVMSARLFGLAAHAGEVVTV